MKIRLAQVQDSSAIQQLIAALSANFFIYPDQREAEPFLASVSLAAVQGYLADTRYRYWLAEDAAGQVVGFIAVRDQTHLFHLFVADSHQRQGLASQLWQIALDYLLESSATTALTVNASLNAVEVYQRWGFQASATIQSMHGIRFLPMSRERNRSSAKAQDSL